MTNITAPAPLRNGLTITLTHRRPVWIDPTLWPIQADAEAHDGGEFAFQANETSELKVRQHADARAIVYGIYATTRATERWRAGGELVPAGDDIVAAISRVCEHLEFPAWLGEECTADLPPEAL